MSSFSNTWWFYLLPTTITPSKHIVLALTYIDVAGPFNPSSSHAHVFILAATDYFPKWAKPIPLRESWAKQVVDFIRTYLIYKYRVSYKIIYV